MSLVICVRSATILRSTPGRRPSNLNGSAGAASRRSGFYLRVLREGEVAPGDVVERVGAEPNRIAVSEAMALYLARKPSRAALRRVLLVADLAAVWREEFEARLA